MKLRLTKIRLFSLYILILCLYFFSISSYPVYSMPPHKIIKPPKNIIYSPNKQNDKNWNIFFNKQQLEENVILRNGIKYIPISLAEAIGVKVCQDTVNQKAYLESPKDLFVLTNDSRYMNSLQTGPQLSGPVFWEDDVMYVPWDFLITLGSTVSLNSMDCKITILKNLTKIKNIRTYWGSEKSRIVLDAQEPVVYDLIENKNEIIIKLFGAEPGPDIKVNDSQDYVSIPSFEKLIKDVKIEQPGQGIVLIRIKKAYATPNQIFALNNPERIILDCSKIFTQESSRNISDGLTHIHIIKGAKNGPLNMNLLNIDPEKTDIKPALAQSKKDGSFGLETVSSITKRNQAMAGINGTYFSQTGNPLGLLLIGNDVISSALYNRSVFFITRNGEFSIKNTKLSASMLIDTENINNNFDAVNMPRNNNQLVLYTPKYGKTTKTATDTNSLEFSIGGDGTVLSQGNNNMAIPADGYVISGHGKYKNWLLQNLKEGKRVIVYQNLNEIQEGLLHAISGGPNLIENGEINITAAEEKFRADIAQGRAPRTAIGITGDKKIIFIAIDGRQESSIGVTLEELASVMQGYGAWEAMNLDGGGSTEMVVNGQVVNSPSDGHERPVSNAVILNKKSK